MPVFNEKVYVSLKLEDGSTDKHPLLRLYDTELNELPESPLVLYHITNGIYSVWDDLNGVVISAFNMPNKKQVVGEFVVYEDAARTIKAWYSETLEYYYLTADLEGKLDALLISGKVDPDIVGILKSEQIVGRIIDNSKIAGSIDDGVLIGTIAQCQEIRGTAKETGRISGNAKEVYKV